MLAYTCDYQSMTTKRVVFTPTSKSNNTNGENVQALLLQGMLASLQFCHMASVYYTTSNEIKLYLVTGLFFIRIFIKVSNFANGDACAKNNKERECNFCATPTYRLCHTSFC